MESALVRCARRRNIEIEQDVRFVDETGRSHCATFVFHYKKKVGEFDAIAVFTRWDCDLSVFAEELVTAGYGYAVLSNHAIRSISLEDAAETLDDWGLI